MTPARRSRAADAAALDRAVRKAERPHAPEAVRTGKPPVSAQTTGK